MKTKVMKTQPPAEFADFVSKFMNGVIDQPALEKMLTDPNNYIGVEIDSLNIDGVEIKLR